MIVAPIEITEQAVEGVIHQVVGGIEFGIPGEPLTFDTPVEVTFPVS